MVRHSGIPGEAPLLLDSPKKTDSDAYDAPVMWPLPDAYASSQPVMVAVLPMILRLRQISIGQISAPDDSYKIPDPTGTSVLLTK
ncbi:hypothetical protein ACQKWADRAFT_316623 [Trichoderma austrokoningii]